MNILLVLSGVGTGGERGSGAGALGPPPKKNILPPSHPTSLLKGPTSGWAPSPPRAVLCTKRDVPKMHGHPVSLPIDTSLWY